LVAGALVALDAAFAALDLKNITLTQTPARVPPHQDIIRVDSRFMGGRWPTPPRRHGPPSHSVMPAKAGIQYAVCVRYAYGGGWIARLRGR